jgi:hypothetical protein
MENLGKQSGATPKGANAGDYMKGFLTEPCQRIAIAPNLNTIPYALPGAMRENAGKICRKRE